MKRFDVDSVRAYAQTHNTKEIAEHFGFASTVTARNFLAENEISPAKTSCQRKEFIQKVRAYAASHTAKEIQQQFGFCSIGRTFNFCRRYGISFVRVKKQNLMGMNDLLQWIVDTCDCSLCKAMNWENDCAETDVPCDEFLCSRLRRFSPDFNPASRDGKWFCGPQKLLFNECHDDMPRTV